MAGELSSLRPLPGSRKERKRVGRGEGSGKGRTCGKGQKGQRSRAGHGIAPGFEGGQMPLTRRLPKRGFKNRFAKDYTVVNVGYLGSHFQDGDTVDLAILKERGLVSRVGRDGLKVLGNGELSISITVRAARFSASAKAKIEGAGGRAEAV